uniref:Uncharacterized protein n=1 Tax=Panagrolaimus sp. JU765 TaxID=591449 RepID=A0AC34R5K7_9BILA
MVACKQVLVEITPIRTVLAARSISFQATTVAVPFVGSDNHLHMVVTCDASSLPNKYTFMQFQDGLAGPIDTAIPKAVADLVCNNGSWFFTMSGVTTAITEVACILGDM